MSNNTNNNKTSDPTGKNVRASAVKVSPDDSADIFTAYPENPLIIVCGEQKTLVIQMSAGASLPNTQLIPGKLHQAVADFGLMLESDCNNIDIMKRCGELALEGMIDSKIASSFIFLTLFRCKKPGRYCLFRAGDLMHNQLRTCDVQYLFSQMVKNYARKHKVEYANDSQFYRLLAS